MVTRIVNYCISDDGILRDVVMCRHTADLYMLLKALVTQSLRSHQAGL